MMLRSVITDLLIHLLAFLKFSRDVTERGASCSCRKRGQALHVHGKSLISSSEGVQLAFPAA